MTPKLKIQRHYPEMALPSRAHPTDAGLDLVAMAVEPVRASVFRIDTGVSVEPPPGYFCEVVPRSSIFKRCSGKRRWSWRRCGNKIFHGN